MRKTLTQIAFDFGPAPDTTQDTGAPLEDAGTSLLITGTEETEEAPVEYEIPELAHKVAIRQHASRERVGRVLGDQRRAI